ncbi:amidohydrolase [Clostridium sp. 19966]|uniref:M20 metallopeptidase family protein n=1 Tax=Clostridium sp. 19966 TaxID=2768166 RepID=UPI0028DDB52F|nr:M20 family metallopeptidase [Clostridium sp. 19966]MDT8718097.1 amidohydrolase [Clostridium sp. 19966]
MDIKTAILNRMDEFKSLSHKLHDNAELSFKEFKTQNIIEEYLNNIGLDYHECINTGVYSIMNKSQECIALRADMDALPVNGVSHACGHDYHMTIVLGTARILSDLGFKKCIKFIFQPGEEDTGGALPMIKEGILENPKVQKIIGFHVWPGLKVGSVEISTEATMASVDDFIIKFKGKGGHAASPDVCINPLIPATSFVNEIYEITRSNSDYGKSHIVTISSLVCGSAPNVVSDEAVVKGTVRTFDEKIREQLKQTVIASANKKASDYNCRVDLLYDEQYPPLLNDEKEINIFENISKEILGKSNIFNATPSFTGEDFAFFAKAVPAVHFRLGICKDDFGTEPLHSSKFTMHEDALFYGILVLVNYILNAEA